MAAPPARDAVAGEDSSLKIDETKRRLLESRMVGATESKRPIEFSRSGFPYTNRSYPPLPRPPMPGSPGNASAPTAAPAATAPSSASLANDMPSTVAVAPPVAAQHATVVLSHNAPQGQVTGMDGVVPTGPGAVAASHTGSAMMPARVSARPPEPAPASTIPAAATVAVGERREDIPFSPPIIPGSENSRSNSGTNPKKRKGSKYTESEDQAIMAGVSRHGENWDAIARSHNALSQRTAVSIRKRYHRISGSGSTPAGTPPKKRRSKSQDRGVRGATSGSVSAGGGLKSGSKSPDGKGEAAAAATGTSAAAAAAAAGKGTGTRKRRNSGTGDPPAAKRKKKTSVAVSTEALAQDNEHLRILLAEKSAAIAELKSQVAGQEARDSEAARSAVRLNEVLREALVASLVSAADYEAELGRARLAGDSLRLGRLSTQRQGHGYVDVWEDGQGFADLERRSREIQREREGLERARKELTKKKKRGASQRAAAAAVAEGSAPDGSLQAVAGAASGDGLMVGGNDTGAGVGGSGGVALSGGAGGGGLEIIPSENSLDADGFARPSSVSRDVALRKEVISSRLKVLKDLDFKIASERKTLQQQKAMHIRELKRLRDEESSDFAHHPTLNGRYVLLKLLGKGGFSEVFLAFDVVEVRRVALKIHSLDVHWTEEKKENYTKHACREYNIHRSLDHPNVVRLYDVFEIDSNSFCTVLEHCDGYDLDHHLKTRKYLPEKEARSIVIQIIDGLVYFNQQPKPIIHYDLKPANILFDTEHMVKITDFGLSKVMETPGQAEMELTSQGAGTYWYLPPETFVVGSTPPRISSKVDVWSVGVIFFQMLYGRKPFGHGLSQQHLLEQGTMMQAREVEFPSQRKVSEEAKEFIRRCLRHNVDRRPDVLGLAKDPYLRIGK